MSKFKPIWYQRSVFDINYDLLKKKGLKLIIFDLDNTISKIGEKTPSNKVKELFNKLSKDFEIIIASNSHKRRVETFCKDLNCFYFANMLKPTKKLYRKVLNSKFIKKEEMCIIGDQLMTDMLLGNRLKIMTILVDPMGKKDLKITSLNRVLEKKIMKRIKIKRGEYYAED